MSSIDRRTALQQMGAVAGLALASRELLSQAATPAPVSFTLPALPYSYEALEPSFDAATMHLHHMKHHQAYVNNLNAAVTAHPELAGKSLEQLLAGLDTLPESARTAVRNNAGGHYNHSFWWPTLGKSGSVPTGELAKAIDGRFGSFSAFQEKFTVAALGVFGSGWTWLVRQSGGTLAIESTPNQDCPLTSGHTPILAVDVWEHAYYLKYQNRRADYVKAFFQILNWNFVSSRFAQKV
ncbi:MAG: superoxide dismutase [Terracidiphilus sp.]|nr:superoxide dismutase [Terracidiphilus sp.]